MDIASLAWQTDLMVRRLAGAVVDERDDVVIVRTPQNPGFYWGNFLLYPAPPQGGEAAGWLDRFAAEFPDTEHVAIGVDGTDGELGAVEPLRAAGLTLERGIALTTEAVTPPFRVDPVAEVRALDVDRDDDWAQVVAVRIAVDEDDSDRHRKFVERKAAESRALVRAGHAVYVGAFVDGVARAGLGVVTDGSGLGRYQTVETHPDFRRRGLAAGAIHQAGEIARSELGVRRLVIVADPDYVAIELYRRLGFVDTEEQVQWQREPA